MPADNPLEQRVRARLTDLDAQGLGRAMRPPGGIDFSSNDYLKLSNDRRILEALMRGAAAEGCGSTGSRLLRGHRDVFAELEERFAAFKRTSRSLFFSSGYLANLAVLPTLTEPGDVIFCDALNHASLIDAARLSKARRVVFPHNDAAALALLMADTPCAGARFLVVESLFSMDGDLAPLAAYAELCGRTGALLVVDEAHAVGVCGERGTGAIELAAVDAGTVVSINTAGKALGVGGAFVCGPEWAIEYLVQRARSFVFSTAAPPAMAHALLASLAVVDSEPERRARLRALSARMRERLAADGIAVAPGTSHIVPVHIGDNDRAVTVASVLQAEGFDVRAIRPPTVPPGTARLRLSINVGLDDETIDRCARLLSTVVREVGACAASS
jgi:8-amino-7-oxononanoate synthase